jgi:hypothetical protein
VHEFNSECVGKARREVKKMDIQTKCLECVGYCALAKQTVPCNGAFPEHCEYNGTEEEEGEEEDGS